MDHMGVIMEIDQRRDERSFAPGLSNGELCILGTDQCFGVEGVRDISGEGIGLNVNGLFPRGALVHLKLNFFGKPQFHLLGNVAWCAPASGEWSDVQKPASFIMGFVCK